MKEIKDSIEQCVLANDRIGLFISGGFDSTTLFYLLCDTIMRVKPNTKILVFTVPRTDASVVHAERVFMWMKQEFPSVYMTIEQVGRPHVHHSIQVTTGIVQVAYLHPRLQLIVGDTKNPDDDLGQEGPVRMTSEYPIVMQPLLKYDKRTTLLLAQDMKVLDKVSEISHTCTESKTLRCSLCWQCRDRAWAFSKLGLTDTGNM